MKLNSFLDVRTLLRLFITDLKLLGKILWGFPKLPSGSWVSF
jgi:hypothetical protein